MSEVETVLVNARQMVDKRWAKGVARDRKGGVCASQAIQDATRIELGVDHLTCHEPLYIAAMDALLLAITPKDGRPGWSAIPAWNDDACTMHRDVLAAFDQAIAHVDPAPVAPKPEHVPNGFVTRLKERLGV